jgi:hypothetical protein
LKAQARLDEFVFVLLAGIVLIVILMMWTIPSEPAAVVQPAAVSLTMLGGSSRQFTLNISTSGNPITNVSLTASGEIANWVSFSQTQIDYIDAYKLVTVYVSVPASTSIKTYKGVIRVSSPGGSKEVQVSISVQNITTVEFLSYPIPIEDFTVSYVSGSEIVDAASNVEVSKGYFSENYLNLVGVLDEDKVKNAINSYIRLLITDTNKLGKLIVEVNGQEVYNRLTELGELIVPVNASLLRRSNVARIRAANPGWMFWDTNVYRIRDASFVVEFRGNTTKEILVDLNQQQVSGFNHMKLKSIVSYDKKPRLRIKVNEQTVYWGEPPIAILDLWIDKDILGNKIVLIPGTNKVVISTESPSQVSFTNTLLTFSYLP